MKISCRDCGTMIEVPERVGFRDTCPACDSWLHSCVHCVFLSGGHCVEPSAEKIGDPEAQNFCEWFRGIDADSAGKGTTAETRETAEDLWKKLVKKKD